MKDFSNRQQELIALRELAARLGCNPLLVQASSGNISTKIDDVLWIKASGKWMVHSEADDFLVAVRLARAKRYLQRDRTIPEASGSSAGGVRASIETAMHAILPQRVVVHVHSVNTIAWAVREDGPKQLSRRLLGLKWQWIPYLRSGNALAKKIGDVISRFPQTDVFVLGNHGLVVCGKDCCSAEQLLADVESRLAVEPRSAPESDFAQLGRRLPGPNWFIPRWAGVHALATDRVSRRILSGGVLYPCQAIFLPDTILPPARSASRELSTSNKECDLQTVRLLEEHGVLCNSHMSSAEQQMFLGLANVVQRIDASAPIRYLTASEVKGVLHGDAESYRLAANTNCYVDTATG
ncbi:MAG TPA: class II aldolase/adducin family protein [Bryobacteraceae bacterium]|nr:class II aldolase/adducin family protein [Bryobacteraceae bacterium]